MKTKKQLKKIVKKMKTIKLNDEESMPVTASPNYQYLVEAFKANNEIRKQLLKDLETVNDLLSKINAAMKQESKK